MVVGGIVFTSYNFRQNKAMRREVIQSLIIYIHTSDDTKDATPSVTENLTLKSKLYKLKV